MELGRDVLDDGDLKKISWNFVEMDAVMNIVMDVYNNIYII